MLRSDVVKDDAGSYDVFTEQESSASHMTAAKVLDVISRLPGCARQAKDAVSAYIQVKMVDAPKLYGHPLAGLLRVRKFEKFLQENGMAKVPGWECLFVHREKCFFSLNMWTTSKWEKIRTT